MIKQKLNILQVSTFDHAGGAEKIAWDLFTSFRRLGHGSWMAVGTKRSQDPDVLCIPKRTNEFTHFLQQIVQHLPYSRVLNNRIELFTHPRQIHSFIKGYENFNYPGTLDVLNLPPNRPDILHCHNLHGGYFDLCALPWLSKQVPTVLTLHDAWLLSGHCAHSFDCKRWKTGCGNCPNLSIYPSIRRDATAYNWQRKADIFKKSRVFIGTPSQWLMDKVNQSILKPAIIESKIIPNGVNLNIFHPAEKEKVREKLGFPPDAKILLFAANGIRKNIWKDYRTLKASLGKIADSGTKLLCIALGEDAPPEYIGENEIRFVPYQKDYQKVACYYQAADIYVHPSRADTFPTTILEALASGTPVVASNVGGVPEQIAEGKTGFLVPVGDADAMADRLLKLLSDENLITQMGNEASIDAKRRFTLDRMVNEYIKFYRKTINEEKRL